MSESSDDEIEAFVIDNGSFMTKSGFAGDDCPRSVISTVVGRHDYNTWMTGMRGKDSYIGPEAQNRRGLLSLSYPINRGVVTNWDDMEKIWNYTFVDELHTSPENRPVLMTAPPLNPRYNSERMAETMFETFNSMAFYVAMQPLLTMYASGRGSGIMFELGDGTSSVVAVYEGHAIRPATRRIPFAGCDLTDYLTARLNERGHSFTSLSDKEIVRNIKETRCYVASDYEKELKSYENNINTPSEKRYELPDGRLISIGAERFRCAEGLFKPDLLGICSEGVHTQIYDSLMKCDIDTRRDLCMSTIVAGSATKLDGFPKRLQSELQQLVPCSKRVKVISPPDRQFSTWIGGSILASLSMFQSLWISKSEYEETGPSIVHSKCTSV